jgi:hypothetical protein
MAMRRTSWIDQRIKDGVAMLWFLPWFGGWFFLAAADWRLACNEAWNYSRHGAISAADQLSRGSVNCMSRFRGFNVRGAHARF